MWYNIFNMKHPHPLVKKLTRKSSSDEIAKPGDYCIVEKLGYADEKKSHKAIVMKCPYCRMDMASTQSHVISESRSWWRRICGLPTTISVSPMLQCPYVPTHRFIIRREKVKTI